MSGRPPHMPNFVMIGIRVWVGQTPSLSQLWGVEICLFSLTRLIAYTTACCYRTSRDSYVCSLFLERFLSQIIISIMTMYHQYLLWSDAITFWVLLFSYSCTLISHQSSYLCIGSRLMNASNINFFPSVWGLLAVTAVVTCRQTVT